MTVKPEKRKRRTPEEIIGKDRLMQLLFEGYAVVPHADLMFKPMCGDRIKGNVSWSYQWHNGPSGGFNNIDSEAAERRIAESAQAVIFHAMSDGCASLTLSATREK
jgi:hypothetical protein